MARIFVLPDGAKGLYPDILSPVEHRLRVGAVIVADNADWSPDYLARVRSATEGYMSVLRSTNSPSLAEEHQLTKRAGREVLDNLVSLITKHLKKGERIRIAGLGILQVRKRGARIGRNPATGEAIKIKASKKVAFRASKQLKAAI